jgi:hypothetical protein
MKVWLHHLRYLQPRALDRKASDEFAVPLCRVHHRAAPCPKLLVARAPMSAEIILKPQGIAMRLFGRR